MRERMREKQRKWTNGVKKWINCQVKIIVCIIIAGTRSRYKSGMLQVALNFWNAKIYRFFSKQSNRIFTNCVWKIGLIFSYSVFISMHKCRECVIFAGCSAWARAYHRKYFLWKWLMRSPCHIHMFFALNHHYIVKTLLYCHRLINNLVWKIDGNYKAFVITSRINCAVIFPNCSKH